MATNAQSKPRVAFLVQRCGVEVNGGAEVHCLQLAQRLAGSWSTEVLTTCALDYVRWENFYPAGAVEIGATTVRRFRVDEPRDITAFNQLSGEIQLRDLDVDLATQEKWMRMQGPVSTALLDYLRESGDVYDAFIFFGYLYATTYFGLPLVARKAFLAPLAHDEWPIYLSMFERLFALPRKLIFNTEAERSFLRLRFPNLRVEGDVIGTGITSPANVRPLEFRKRYGLEAPLLLYVGRVDESKGCGALIEYYLRARRAGLISHKLVLIGKEVMPIPFHDDVVHLGFVAEQEKWDAMAAADWLLMPSPHESLSIVLLEAWSVQRPGLVNGRSDVLRAHCEQSHGGLWYESYEEWVSVLMNVTPTEREALGRQGAAYVETRYTWPRVERDYLSLLPPGSPR